MDKIVVITGASGGLGHALATAFAGGDWQVVGTGRSVQPTDMPKDVMYKQFDASDAPACESFWQSLQQEYPKAEICLVNNAGGWVSGGLLATKPEDFEQQIRSCYLSAVYMTRGLAAAFPKARIINIISSSALAPEPENPAYGAAKAAERYFFQALQQEFKPEQYQITNLYPSYIATAGPDPNAMSPQDLSSFVRQQAESTASYYLRDVTIYPFGSRV